MFGSQDRIRTYILDLDEIYTNTNLASASTIPPPDYTNIVNLI